MLDELQLFVRKACREHFRRSLSLEGHKWFLLGLPRLRTRCQRRVVRVDCSALWLFFCRDIDLVHKFASWLYSSNIEQQHLLQSYSSRRFFLFILKRRHLVRNAVQFMQFKKRLRGIVAASMFNHPIG
jgi:hypothetical protein